MARKPPSRGGLCIGLQGPLHRPAISEGPQREVRGPRSGNAVRFHFHGALQDVLCKRSLRGVGLRLLVEPILPVRDGADQDVAQLNEVLSLRVFKAHVPKRRIRHLIGARKRGVQHDAQIGRVLRGHSMIEVSFQAVELAVAAANFVQKWLIDELVETRFVVAAIKARVVEGRRIDVECVEVDNVVTAQSRKCIDDIAVAVELGIADASPIDIFLVRARRSDASSPPRGPAARRRPRHASASRHLFAGAMQRSNGTFSAMQEQLQAHIERLMGARSIDGNASDP